MEWIETVIETKSAALELIAGVLFLADVYSYEIIDHEENRKFLLQHSKNWDYAEEELLAETGGPVLVKFHIPNDEHKFAALSSISLGLAELRQNNQNIDFGELTLRQNVVEDTHWLDNWKKYYKPFKVGKNIIVRPFWEEFSGDGLIFSINPGHLFGTGLHETTKMCMTILEDMVKKGDIVSDIGCGSGILSVLSLMFGAKHAFACDIETQVAEVVLENAELNGVSGGIDVLVGNILEDDGLMNKMPVSDIIVANIVADVIIELCALIKPKLKAGGKFVCSGIIDERAEEVRAALNNNGYAVISELRLEGWNCIVSKR